MPLLQAQVQHRDSSNEMVMTKISADVELNYRNASDSGRRAILEKLQRYIDRGLWAQSVVQALKIYDAARGPEAAPQKTAIEDKKDL